MNGKETLSNENQHLRSAFTGASVVALNVGLSSAFLSGIQQCAGSCAGCGGRCLIPAAGFLVTGAVAYVVKTASSRKKIIPENKSG
jgi:hypothetical protein